jgi:uncharacterized protein (TIRG00374 family)
MPMSDDAPPPEPASPASAPAPARPHALVRFGFGVVLAGLALFLAVELAGGMADALDALGDVDVRWLLAGLAAETVSYVLLSWQLRRLAGPDADLTRGAAFRLGLVVFGLGLITPASPAEGMVLASAELSRRGLTRRRAALTLVFSEWYANATLWVLASSSVLTAAMLDDVPADERGPLVAVAVAMLATLALIAALARRQAVVEWFAVRIGSLRPRRQRRPVEERRAVGARWYADAATVTTTRRDRVFVVVLALAAWGCDALCLFFALVAAGTVVRPDVLLLAYTTAVIAASVPLVPAGFGVVEAALPALLASYGVHHATALAGALAYRGLGTVLPALAGAIVVPGLRVVRRRRGRTRTDATLTATDAVVSEAP